MPKLGSGEIQFQGCLLNPAVAICLCFHQPQCVPDRDRILAHLVKTGVDLDGDFSLVLDSDGNEDVILLFGNSKTLAKFQALVNTLAVMTGTEDAAGTDTRSCSVCGYTERIGIPGITYSRIGPYSGICFDCLSGTNR